MTNNNIDLNIANVLSNVANIVFNSLTISGDYTGTASEIAKHFSKSVSIYFSIEYMEKKQLTKAQKAEYEKLSPALPRHTAVKVKDQSGDNFEIKNNMVFVSVDSFRASFHSYDVFQFLAKFEVIAGVKTAHRASFTHSAKKEEGEKITVTFPAAAKELLKHVEKNTIRKVFDSIYFDAVNSTFVASDGRTCAVIPVTMSAHLPEFEGITIPTATAKNVLKLKEMKVTVCRHEIRVNDIICESLRFPRYTSVFPYYKGEEDQRIIFAKNAWRELLKQIKKEDKNTRIYFRARSGENKLYIYICGEFDYIIKNSFVLPLAAPAVASFAKIFTVGNISRFKDVEIFRGLESCRASILEGAGLVSLAMPCQWQEIDDLTESWHQYQDTTSAQDRNFCPLNAVLKPAEEMAEPENVAPAEEMAEPENVTPAEEVAEPESITPAEEMAEPESITPAEEMAESESITPAEEMAEPESGKKYAFIASFITVAAACLLAFFVLHIKPNITATAAVIVAPSESMAPAEEVAESESITPAEEVAEPESITPAEEVAEPENVTPAEEVAESENVTPAEEMAEPESITPAEEVAESENVTPAEEVAEPDTMEAATAFYAPMYNILTGENMNI